MKKVLVIAPHPDDETLGCGGTLLRHLAEGDEVHWLIATTMEGSSAYSLDVIQQREREISQVASEYGFNSYSQLPFAAAKLDKVPCSDFIAAISDKLSELQPEVLYLPYRNDVHSDHAFVFDAAIAAAKTFRAPWVHSIYAYETLSETEFGLRPDDSGFRANLFISIEAYLEKKLSILQIFKDEMGIFPFPRSTECVKALAILRGSQSGFHAAEAFMLLKEMR
jgi:LmbE family N-acetylglucosaminyl deacetylase